MHRQSHLREISLTGSVAMFSKDDVRKDRAIDEIRRRSRGLARYVGHFRRVCGGKLNSNARVGSQCCTFAAQ
jgi:hypothetical protein